MYLLPKIFKTNIKCKVIVNQNLKNKINKLRTTSSYNIWLLLRNEVLLVRLQEPVDQFLILTQQNMSTTLQKFHWAMESLFNIYKFLKL